MTFMEDPRKGFVPYGTQPVVRQLTCEEADALVQQMQYKEEISNADFLAVGEHLRTCTTKERHQ